MAAGKFSFLDIVNAQSRAETGDVRVEEYTEIYLNPYDVEPSKSNFYSQENIEELAETFLAVGQQQPTVLGRINGEYRIISGHRRNLANRLLVDQGYDEFKQVRYLYRDMTEATFELSLLIGNAFNRELTPYEKTEQAIRMKNALIRAKKEDGLEIPGRLRATVANLLGESSTNVARMESIHKNLAEPAREQFKAGNMGITAAYETSKLTEDQQKEIAKAAAEKNGIRAKEIAQRVTERKAEVKDKTIKEQRFECGDIHNIKLASEYYEDVSTGRKSFEIRKNDGEYKVGDVLRMCEIKDGSYTGRVIKANITYMLEEYTGLQEGFCIFEINVVSVSDTK